MAWIGKDLWHQKLGSSGIENIKMSPCIIILHDFVPLVFCNVVVEVGVVSFLHSRLGVEHKNNSGRLFLVAAVMFWDESVRKPGQELVAVDG